MSGVAAISVPASAAVSAASGSAHVKNNMVIKVSHCCSVSKKSILQSSITVSDCSAAKYI